MSKRASVAGLVVAVSLLGCKEPPPPATTRADAVAPAPSPPRVEMTVTSPVPAAVEAFLAGRDLLENRRDAEAVDKLRRAVELDGKFALAQAYLGYAVPGPDQASHLDAATANSASLPEPERRFVAALVAQARGDHATARSELSAASKLLPTDWRPLMRLGLLDLADGKLDDAVATLRHAADVDPDAAPVFNVLGYTFVEQGKYDDAITAFKRYVWLRPSEPNSSDSLAETYMAAGRLPEAEAAFFQAIEKSPRFYFAWQGIALARFYRGDVAGAREACQKGEAAATTPWDKLDAREWLAWIDVAAGAPADAVQVARAVVDEAAKEKLPRAQVHGAIALAVALASDKKLDEASKVLAGARETMTKYGFDDDDVLRRTVLYWQLWGGVAAGKPADVEKLAAAIKADVAKQPAADWQATLPDVADGAVALVKGDAKGAIAHFSRCTEDYHCRAALAHAEDLAGDAAAAKATRDALAHTYRRDTLLLVARAQAH